MKEIELKMLCEDGFSTESFVEQLKALAKVTDLGEGLNLDTYYDTDQRCLAGAGLSARLRVKKDKCQLDIKAVPIVPELIMERAEFTKKLTTKKQAVRSLKQWVEKEWPLKLVGDPKPQLVIRSLRRKFLVEASAYKAELCIDQVTVCEPRKQTGPGFQELEFELVEGDSDAFHYVATLLSQQQSLVPSTQSKYLRGLALLGKPGYSYGPEAPAFKPMASVDEVARAVCRWQFETMKAYEPGTRVGLDLEHLHKMRVATRRLRNALTVFQDAFHIRTQRFLSDHFKWLAAVLGEVRDLDVHQVKLGDWRQQYGATPEEGWSELQGALKSRWKAARRRLVRALNGARYRKLCQRAEETFSQTPTRRRQHPAARPVGLLCEEAIQKRTRQFRKRVKAVHREGTPESLHELRKIGKKLRYTAECFKPVLGSRFKLSFRRMAEFQDQLGDFNDSCVAGELAQALRDEALAKSKASPSYLYVLGVLVGGTQVAAKATETECHRALATLGGKQLTRDLDKSAAKIARSTEKKAQKRLAAVAPPKATAAAPARPVNRRPTGRTAPTKVQTARPRGGRARAPMAAPVEAPA